MNKAIFVITIAIIATLISTTFQLYMRNREVTPAFKRFLRILFLVGVVIFIITFFFIGSR